MSYRLDDRPTWQLVIAGARSLGAEHTPVSLADLIAYVQSIDPSRDRTSIQPIVQGMTKGTRSAPRSACGQVLERVDRGMYRLDPSDPVPTDASDALLAQPIQHASSSSRQRSSGPRQRRVDARVGALIEQFDDLVELYDREVPFRRSGQFDLHRRTIDRRRFVGSARAAAADEEFTTLLHQTLQAWGIGKRASRLVPLADFRRALENVTDQLGELDGRALEQAEADGKAVWAIVRDLPIVDNVSRIVPGTKTLHHLLPDLVPPMDRQWTGRFFEWNAGHLQSDQERAFAEAWQHMTRIAAATNPARLVGAGWRTSSSKVVDNAIVAFGMR